MFLYFQNDFLSCHVLLNNRPRLLMFSICPHPLISHLSILSTLLVLISARTNFRAFVQKNARTQKLVQNSSLKVLCVKVNMREN